MRRFFDNFKPTILWVNTANCIGNKNRPGTKVRVFLPRWMTLPRNLRHWRHFVACLLSKKQTVPKCLWTVPLYLKTTLHRQTKLILHFPRCCLTFSWKLLPKAMCNTCSFRCRTKAGRALLFEPTKLHGPSTSFHLRCGWSEPSVQCLVKCVQLPDEVCSVCGRRSVRDGDVIRRLSGFFCGWCCEDGVSCG